MPDYGACIFSCSGSRGCTSDCWCSHNTTQSFLDGEGLGLSLVLYLGVCYYERYSRDCSVPGMESGPLHTKCAFNKDSFIIFLRLEFGIVRNR